MGATGGRCWCVAVAVTLTAVVASPAGARSSARPDLVISKGSVRVTASRLAGSFVVRDKGATARRSTATLTTRATSRTIVVKRFTIPALRRSRSRTVKVSAPLPTGLAAGTYALRACADGTHRLRERSEANNCRTVGTFTVKSAALPAAPVPIADPAPAPQPGPGDPSPPSSVPANPVAYTPNAVFTLDSPQSKYWLDVPSAYDSSNATPITLFVWLHGCSANAADDIHDISPGGAQSYIALAVGGREGDCWDVDSDTPKVLAAIADVKTHFNINPRRVILGGYSSGGDLTYRVAFYNAKTFAGVLVENSSPFRDTGSSQSASLSAAAWKFNIVHLAHSGDTEFPLAGVQNEIKATQDAGFPATLTIRPGSHADGSTTADMQTYLLPHINDGWLAPAS